MIAGKAIMAAVLMATSTAISAGVFAAEGKITAAEKHELRQERREFRRDVKDA